MARLGDVCSFFSGTGFPNAYQGQKTGKYPFYKVGDISKNVLLGNRELIFSDNYIEDDTVQTIKGTVLPPKTVVFAKIGEALRLNRRAITNCYCLVDNNAMGILADNTVLDELYFYYFMCSVDLQHYCESTTVPSVRKTRIAEIEIPLPPLEEQRRIAALLDKVSDLIAKRREQLRKLDELVKARFAEMFGDFKLNTKNWPVVSFDEIAIIDGNMTTDYEKYANYPHIGIDSIEKETGALTGYRTVAEDGVISGKYLFTPKHIIYSKIRPNLNKVALPDFSGLCSADAYPILPIEEKCNRVFLAYDMRSQFFLDYILQFCNRTNLPKVNRKEVSGFKTPLPPIKLQNKFATFVEQTNKSKLTIQQSLDKLEALKKALMQQYFG